jgi:hypothetical protein
MDVNSTALRCSPLAQRPPPIIQRWCRDGSRRFRCSRRSACFPVSEAHGLRHARLWAFLGKATVKSLCRQAALSATMIAPKSKKLPKRVQHRTLRYSDAHGFQAPEKVTRSV